MLSLVFDVLLSLFLLKTPDTIWVALLCWLLRMTTFALFLRSYLFPLILSKISKHFSVRSISLRSIRGLYMYREVGRRSQTWKVERISYSWSSELRHLTIKIEGLTLETDKLEHIPISINRHRRSLTMVTLSYTRRRFWEFSSGVFILLDPIVRPFVRTAVIACLRSIIVVIPSVTSAVYLDIKLARVVANDLSGLELVSERVNLHTSLEFTPIENAKDIEPQRPPVPSPTLRKSYSIAAWKSRFKGSFRRSWNRAVERSLGVGSVSLELQNVVGSISHESAPDTVFFRSPAASSLQTSLTFNPAHGFLFSHSVKTNVKLGSCFLEMETLLHLVKSLKANSPPTHEVPTPQQPPSSPFLSPLISPRSPLMRLYSPMLQTPTSTSSASPTSPLLESLSASILPRRHFYQPCMKLKDTRQKAALSFINDVQVHISSISLNSRSKSNFQDSHKVVVENITLSAALSDPHKDVHHSNLLGRNQHVEAFDSDVYSVNFSVAEVRVTRTSLQDHIRLFTLNRFGLHILTTQWPSPLLVTSPFIGGDPNAPLLKMRIEIGSVHLTERAEVLSDFLSNMQPSEKKAVAQKPVAPFPLPRVMLEVNCGPILGRLLLGTESARCSHMFELRSEGIRFTLRSHFDRRSAACDDVLDDFDRLPLEMNADLSFAMESILVKTVVVTMERRQSFQFLESTGPDFFDQPPFISIDSIEIRGTGNMFADIRDDTQNTACVYPSTLLSELRCCVETVCIELWHPETIAALLRVVNLIPEPADRLNGSSPHIPLREKLPVGLTMSWSLARFVVFVTSPDINPNDDMELSRGFALRATGISVQYCALNAGHLSRCQTLHKLSLLRHDLRLPGEQGLLALKSTESSVNELWKSQSAFISISFSHVAVRSALSTQYAADDPFIAERDDTGIEVRDFLQLRSGVIQICLKSSESHPQDACEISSRIALIDISFLLAHVYSTMLGLQTIKTLSHARSRPIQTPQNTNTLLYHLDMDVDAIQANCTFGKEHVFLRLNSLSVKAISEKPVTVCLRKAVCWVRMSVVNNRWEEGRGTKWEELLSLQKWSIRLPSRKEKSILIDGETLRFRVPYGYVFANLVLDLSVAIKAIRHLHLIASNSRHSGIPSPEAEGPKQVPSIILNVSFLSLEATDDPLEVKLNRIFNAGPEAAIAREEREEAFKVKVCNILSAEGLPVPEYDGEREWEFGPKHSISIQEARSRLDGIHVLDWKQRLDIVKGNQLKAQQDFFHRLHIPYEEPEPLPVPIESCKVGNDPPLFRLSLDGLSLNVSGPSFSMDKLPEFLYQQGGLPVGTEYSLLVPMHLNFTLKSLRVTLRDYPLAMIDIPVHSDETLPAFEFDTDLVIAEEMGSELSVDWIDCPILRADEDVHDIATFSLSVPKTIMPVKTYANPEIRVTAPGITSFSWAVSYAPATQDLMRVVESLTSSPRDTSPSMGFWDKMRLIFHWSIRATFKGEVRYYMKGLRDPHDTLTAGSGFVLAWEGNTKLLVGRKNEERELVQIISDTMSIAIPKLASLPEQPAPWFRKTCAKLTSGVRFGVGFVFERTCGPSCSTCKGSSFDRQCRYFDFKPHYEVRMEKKKRVPLRNGPEDSFTKFRSDFIHLSISLTSSLRGLRPGLQQQSSSLHLTPQAFAHFWGWCSLFDNALSLPIRLGTCYPHRIISPKFGRHIATIKYRIHVPRLYVMHGYIDDSKETWIDGVTPWIGVKAMLDELQVDMHQRDQESITPGSEAAFTKVTRHKPFYAAELVMKGLDLRAIVATFPDPLKKLVELKNKQSGRSNYRSRDDFSSFEQDPSWYDPKDFVEIDWSSALEPELRVLPIASCPRVAYFKRNLAAVEETLNTSKFGDEDTHQCVLGKEPTVPQVQISLVSERIRFLKDSCKITRDENLKASRQKMVSLLEQYIAHLINVDKGGSDISGQDGSQNYQMSADFVSPHEWAEFDNVFQIHCPKIFMDSAIRDIMMQYYYCSRARRGMEYHMATRAVKFIRDQAKAALVSSEEDHSKSPAHAAASAIKRILIGENHKSTEGNVDILPTLPSSDELDPMNGWSDGVSLRKSYCCLLLKPQVVLRNRGNEKDVCVVAAVQAKLQSFRIMDDSNVDDPVSGKVMTRTYAALSGMQTFAPSFRTNAGDGCVPLEVLIDLRCESDTFERLVPQTDATFHYDKFNRLRLRNNVTSVVPRKSVESATSVNHLQDQTDLIQVNIPRFTVSATDQNFQTISHIITKLLLFSDAAHKTRLDKLETLLFTYDFTSSSSADVVAKMQRRMRLALHAERMAEKHGVMDLDMEGPTRELMKLRAHKYLISEELNLLFEAIKLAQDRSDDQGDRKSAVLLHASSSEISWRMLDESRDLLAKLSVQNIHHYWLSRQDSSTVNNLSVGNLQAFDGSKDALWAEILCKHDEPANHPLLKRRLFLLANWAVLPPVGGITIYENFEVTLHPLRLQVDARVGRRILEYLWPSRKKRRQESDGKQSEVVNDEPTRPVILPRVSLDTAIPKSPKISRELSDSSELGLVPPSLRRLGVSRSFTDLRSSAAESSPFLSRSSLQRTRSSELLRSDPDASELKDGKRFKHRHDLNQKVNKFGDAAEMKTRSSQKTFVLVRISSLHVLLSIMKEESFVCQDARIRTRDLEYRNQTTSFEELVNQFIPSDMSWKGWVKMAFHQPLVPVLPVARELISKTKWIASKGTEEAETQKPPPKQSSSKDAGQVEKETEEGRLSVSSNESLPVTNSSPAHAWKKASHRKLDTSATTITPSPLNSEPETFDSEAVTSRPTNRNRVLSVFRRKTSRTPTGIR